MRLRPVYVHHTSPILLWEQLRLTRNLCLDGLTGRRTEITPEEQRGYIDTYDVEFVRHYLFKDDRGFVVGFARIEYDPTMDAYIPSLGVIPSRRGHGIGRELVRQVMMMTGGRMVGELFVENKAIQKIDYSLGWRPVGEPDGDVQPVECPWPPPFTEVDREARQQEVYDEIVRYHESTGDGLE